MTFLSILTDRYPTLDVESYIKHVHLTEKQALVWSLAGAGGLHSKQARHRAPARTAGRGWVHHGASPLGSLHAGTRGLQCNVPATVGVS